MLLPLSTKPTHSNDHRGRAVDGYEYRTRDVPEHLEGDIAMSLSNCSYWRVHSAATHTDDAARARGVQWRKA